MSIRMHDALVVARPGIYWTSGQWTHHLDRHMNDSYSLGHICHAFPVRLFCLSSVTYSIYNAASSYPVSPVIHGCHLGVIRFATIHRRTKILKHPPYAHQKNHATITKCSYSILSTARSHTVMTRGPPECGHILVLIGGYKLNSRTWRMSPK